MKKTCYLLFVVLFLQQNSFAQAVTIPGSQTRKISSSIIPQQEFELQIMLPAGYAKSNKKYPVLYLMDSQWDFPLVTALYGQQYFDGFVPEMIIVGVTWTGKYSNPDSLRARDYTPTNVKQTQQSGGADKFLSFMKGELFPLVESQYKADKTKRILMGCSLGGLFTVYTFFTQPDLFQGYVAASPAIAWDNEVIYEAAKKYDVNSNKATVRLFLCEGGVERGVPLYEKFVQYLTDRRYKNLQLKSQVLDNTGHSGTKGTGYEKGLQYVFEKPSIQLTEAQLKRIVGQYKTTGGYNVEINAESNSLILQVNGTNKFSLLAADQNELYSKAEFLKLHFKQDDKGSISGFDMERYGSNQSFIKIK